MKNKVLKEWIGKAEQDRNASRALIAHRKAAVYDVICFHCQQCIEKYLKAYLTANKLSFPKMHDLMGILDLVAKKDGAFELIRDLIRPLDKFAVRFRYPGDEAKRPQAKQAIELMDKAREFIRDRIPGL